MTFKHWIVLALLIGAWVLAILSFLIEDWTAYVLMGSGLIMAFFAWRTNRALK